MKAVLFDLDGTLTDPKEGITKSVEYALNRYGITIADRDELIPFIGPPLYESFVKYYGFTEEEAKKAVDVYREYFKPTGMFENYVYKGIPELLSKLKDEGYTIILATSKPEVFARRITEKFGLDVFMDEQVGSELDGGRIKKSDVIEEAVRRCKVNRSSAIMVGDKSHDIIGAREAGIPAIAVSWGYALPGEIEEAKPLALAESPSELFDIIRRVL